MKYIIIGGVAGGASAAARLRRMDEHAEIIMFEKGDYISYANCGLPYYIGDTISERDALFLQTPQSFSARFNISVKVGHEVLSINPQVKTVQVKDLKNNKVFDCNYDKLILSPGAEPVKPPISGIETKGIFTLRNVPDTDRIKNYLAENKIRKAVVVGAGFIGLEMAENLHELGIEVSIIERVNQVMAPLDYTMATVIHQHLISKNVGLYLGEAVNSFSKNGGQIRISMESGKTLDTDMVILSIGVKPDTRLAISGNLKIGETGGILVNEFMQTSDESIYAVGDAVEFPNFLTNKPFMNYLAGPANKQARIAADNMVEGNKYRYKGSIATAIAKVFDLTVAATGPAAKHLDRLNIPYLESITHSGSHAGYYPGSKQMSIKIVYDNEGKLWGAQIVGFDGVDKRIDMFATVLANKGNITDLTEIEHAYAPPYSSAKDPVNMAGFVAENILTGKLKSISWDNLEKQRNNPDVFVLDVRTHQEFQLSHIPNAKNIPLDELRDYLNDIPRDKKIFVYCAVGLRGYIGSRILTQNGFENVFNLNGGFKTYENAVKPQNYVSKKQSKDVELEHIDTIKPATDFKILQVNACGLQCPGPILKLKKSMENISDGDRIEISSSDGGFFADAQSWAKMTGNKVIDIKQEQGIVKAVIEKSAEKCPLEEGHKPKNGKTLVVFSNDLDKALASFIIANGAAAAGKTVTMFFTFWGLSILKKKNPPKCKRSFLDKMFGMMLPKSSLSLPLSQWNMLGIGSGMMRKVMASKQVDSLESLIQQALDNGVEIIACRMSMDVMGIKETDLIDGINYGGVANYIERTDNATMNLFV
ncbi:MAG: FAD-dependent oxidoreductase [Bacteroidales bacterium]